MKIIFYLSVLCYCFVYFTCLFAKEDKRLLLTDPDVSGQMQTLINRLHVLEAELAAIKTERTNTGSFFIRWGRKTCNGSNSQLLYSGFAAGQHYNDKGGPSNMLCLPDNPELSNVTTAKSSLLYGTEYESDVLRVASKNEDVPCAVCENTQTHMSMMIPGRKSCYDGWRFEYNGLLASNYWGYAASTYICVDGNPEFILGGQNDENGNLLYITSTKCGALPCPPYTNDAAVNCVVCSK